MSVIDELQKIFEEIQNPKRPGSRTLSSGAMQGEWAEERRLDLEYISTLAQNGLDLLQSIEDEIDTSIDTKKVLGILSDEGQL